MTTNATVGGFTFKRKNHTASPQAFVALTECYAISGLGAQNELVDATHFGSAGSREYIGGLADGVEITVECNYVGNDAQQEAMITDVGNKYTNQFQVLFGSSSPNVLFSFSGVCLGYEVVPSVDGRNSIRYTVKISGAVTVS